MSQVNFLSEIRHQKKSIAFKLLGLVDLQLNQNLIPMNEILSLDNNQILFSVNSGDKNETNYSLNISLNEDNFIDIKFITNSNEDKSDFTYSIHKEDPVIKTIISNEELINLIYNRKIEKV